ncbi:MAG: NifU family protein [Cytophagales bacterium]|nr:MAG: NifU family protein [Cytophagales bacterium]
MNSTSEKRIIEVYTESNPNPNSLKFVTDVLLINEGSVDFADVSSTENCPLAKDLFKFNFIKRVFITSNFITITKVENIEWFEISPIIKTFIKSYLEDGNPLFLDDIKIDSVTINENEPEIIGKIKAVLEEYVKPAVEQDGGAIYFDSFEDGIVKVSLQGSCSGCPSSTITLKAGIENLLIRLIPEVKQVVAVEG